jgi:transposase
LRSHACRELHDDSPTTVDRWMPPEDELRRLYVEERWDPDRIGAHYGFSRTTVYDWLRALGIRRSRPPRSSWARTVSKEYLAALYQRLRTLDRVAAHERVTRGQVERAMKHHGLDRRRPPDWARPARTPPLVDEMRRVYQEQGSVRGFAAHYRVGVRTAHRWLHEGGIQLQPPGRPGLVRRAQQ